MQDYAQVLETACRRNCLPVDLDVNLGTVDPNVIAIINYVRVLGLVENCHECFAHGDVQLHVVAELLKYPS